MGRCIFSKSNYRIIKCDKNSYLVININKDFKHGHTHIFNYKLAKIIIYACIKGEFPSKEKSMIRNKRMVQSVTRVCSNKYYNKFKSLLDNIT